MQWFGDIARNCAHRKQNESVNVVDLSWMTERGSVALISSTVNKPGEWFIDSAATKHMTYDKMRIKNYVVYEEPTKIYLGNDTVVLPYGEGNVNLTPSTVCSKLDKELDICSCHDTNGCRSDLWQRKYVLVKNGKKIIIRTLPNKKLY